MKSILLASVSVVAFAGAAAAEGHETPITFGGSATLGYNDTVEEDFYWEADLGVTMTQALNNGLTAGASFNLNIADDNRGGDVVADSYVLSLTAGDLGGLFFGDVDPVAESNWGGVDGSAVAGFNDADVHFDVALFEAILRGEVNFGATTAMVSFGVDTDGVGLGNDIDAMQVYLSSSFGAFNVALAYQEEFGPTPEILGVEAGTSFGGADVTLAYETDGTETSMGVALSYPIGPITAGAYYTSNEIADASFGVSAAYAAGAITLDAAYDVDQGADGVFGLDATYDLGNGIMVLAGLADNGDAYYVASTVDLGGGASLLVSYADDSNNPLNDAIGGPEYMAGVTAELSLSF
jgi:outer membrane protein OmpU